MWSLKSPTFSSPPLILPPEQVRWRCILHGNFLISNLQSLLFPCPILVFPLLGQPALSRPSPSSCSSSSLRVLVEAELWFPIPFQAQKTFLRAAPSFSIDHDNSGLKEEITFMKNEPHPQREVGLFLPVANGLPVPIRLLPKAHCGKAGLWDRMERL